MLSVKKTISSDLTSSSYPSLVPLHIKLWYIAEDCIRYAKDALPFLRIQTFQAGSARSPNTFHKHRIKELSPSLSLDAPTSDLSIQEKYKKCVLTSIKCLEAVLCPDTNKHTANVLYADLELKTRFRLAEIYFGFTDNMIDAERHLQKAILLCYQLKGREIDNLRYCMLDFQCQIYTKTGSLKLLRNVLKNNIQEALTNDMVTWGLQFQIRLANLYRKEGEMLKYFSAMKNAYDIARKLGNREELGVLLSQAQTSIIGHNYISSNQPLSECSRLCNGMIVACPFGIEQKLQLQCLATTTLYHIQLGNSELAKKELGNLMEKAESLQKNNSNYNFNEIGKSDATSLTTHQIYAFVYIISGIFHKSNTALTTSKSFFVEGLKFINKELDSTNRRDSMENYEKELKWYMILKCYLLRHLSEFLIVRNETPEAEKTILAAITTSFSLEKEVDFAGCSIWERFQFSFGLDYGMLAQASGFGSLAEHIYHCLILMSSNSQCPQKNHISIVAQMNLLLMNMVDNDNVNSNSTRKVVRTLEYQSGIMTHVEELIQQCGMKENKIFECAQLIIKSLLSTEVSKAKELLMHGLKLASHTRNSQLQCVSVTILGSIYSFTQYVQSEKMLSTGYLIACKSQNYVLNIVCGQLLCGLYEKLGKEVYWKKQKQLNEDHRNDAKKHFNTQLVTFERLLLRIGKHGLNEFDVNYKTGGIFIPEKIIFKKLKV